MTKKDLKIPALRHPEKQRRPDNAQPKKPDWIRVKAPVSEGYKKTRDIMREHKLVTVCEEAGCPNVGECWSQGHATMMIMGDVCTRACTFCNIATGKPPEDLDVFEPGRVADAVKKLGLNHVVVTSVDRDDVEDGGAEHFAQTIRAIRRQSPSTTIEILTPDFIRCDPSVLEVVVAAKPDVFNHNLETVPGLYTEVRPGARPAKTSPSSPAIAEASSAPSAIGITMSPASARAPARESTYKRPRATRAVSISR